MTGQAIVEFNLTRRDEKWGTLALINMIELYLNPDSDNIWDDSFDSKNTILTEQQQNNLNAAETLLRELEPKIQ